MQAVNTLDEFNTLIKEENCLIVVDFFATWCGPCKVMAPHLTQWAEEFPDVKFIKIDVDENSETAEVCEVSAMPTFLLYKGGQKVDMLVGANKEKLKDMIIKHMK